MMKFIEDCPILENRRLKGDYFQLDVRTQRIAGAATPGQFVHIRFPKLYHRILRRPFSIYNASAPDGVLSVIYKAVGEGTRHMRSLQKGDTLNLMGPLGHGFTLPSDENKEIIIVAGGYGCASTYLLAVKAARPPAVFLGGRTGNDLLLVDEFRQLGCDVAPATDDGSVGHRGFVTEVLEDRLKAYTSENAPAVFACGPNPMLIAVAKIVTRLGMDAQLSMDQHMGCGLGACMACVIKTKAASPQGWKYQRTCANGPVFRASRIYIE